MIWYLVDRAVPLAFVGAAVLAMFGDPRVLGMLLIGLLLLPVWAFGRWWRRKGWSVVP